jgi:hypothetical protein
MHSDQFSVAKTSCLSNAKTASLFRKNRSAGVFDRDFDGPRTRLAEAPLNASRSRNENREQAFDSKKKIFHRNRRVMSPPEWHFTAF